MNKYDHPEEVKTAAKKIYDEYNPEARGKEPTTTKAACHYLAYLATGNKDRISQLDLADEFGCAEASMRKRKLQILEVMNVREVVNGTD